MVRAWIILGAVLLGGVAGGSGEGQAADPTDSPFAPLLDEPAPPPLSLRTLTPERARSLKVTREDCAWVVAHRPAPDVAYRPGVDVQGRPVEKADLEDWSAWSGGVEQGVRMGLAADPFATRRGASPTRRLQQPEIPLGVLVYDAATGLMTLDGVPVNEEQTSLLAAVCRAHGY